MPRNTESLFNFQRAKKNKLWSTLSGPFYKHIIKFSAGGSQQLCEHILYQSGWIERHDTLVNTFKKLWHDCLHPKVSCVPINLEQVLAPLWKGRGSEMGRTRSTCWNKTITSPRPFTSLMLLLMVFAMLWISWEIRNYGVRRHNIL